ncbi:MAG: DUF1232 domain-containing protein [Proteobacteria bacterium]|nr:DUF1232 domain-containing protein [Pseudomonadota bacterium]
MKKRPGKAKAGSWRVGLSGGVLAFLPAGLRLIASIIFLVAAVVYSLWPLDVIPDILGPVGWIDDVMFWCLIFLVEFGLWRKGRPRKDPRSGPGETST